jgi:hypothetical protein
VREGDNRTMEWLEERGGGGKVTRWICFLRKGK